MRGRTGSGGSIPEALFRINADGDPQTAARRRLRLLRAMAARSQGDLRKRPGTSCPTWPSRSSARATRRPRSSARSANTSRPASAGSGSSSRSSARSTSTSRPRKSQILGLGDSLDGGDLLPGFRLAWPSCSRTARSPDRPGSGRVGVDPEQAEVVADPGDRLVEGLVERVARAPAQQLPGQGGARPGAGRPRWRRAGRGRGRSRRRSAGRARAPIRSTSSPIVRSSPRPMLTTRPIAASQPAMARKPAAVSLT